MHLFVTFMLYPGSPGGDVTVAGIKILEDFLSIRLQSRKVSQLSYSYMFLLQSTILLADACMGSTIKAASSSSGYAWM